MTKCLWDKGIVRFMTSWYKRFHDKIYPCCDDVCDRYLGHLRGEFHFFPLPFFLLQSLVILILFRAIMGTMTSFRLNGGM